MTWIHMATDVVGRYTLVEFCSSSEGIAKQRKRFNAGKNEKQQVEKS